MPDITMCKGDECPLKETCYRHNAKPSEFRQSYFMNPPYGKGGEGCSHYWPDEKVLSKSQMRRIEIQMEAKNGKPIVPGNLI